MPATERVVPVQHDGEAFRLRRCDRAGVRAPSWIGGLLFTPLITTPGVPTYSEARDRF